jgi:hypothetical protein
VETDHVDRPAYCPACRAAERTAPTYADAVRAHEEGVTLAVARCRVGVTMQVDPEWWAWSPDEIRWLAHNWRMCLPLPPPLPARVPIHVGVFRYLVDGVKWWMTESPLGLRFVGVLGLLFGYAFVYGWFSA